MVDTLKKIGKWFGKLNGWQKALLVIAMLFLLMNSDIMQKQSTVVSGYDGIVATIEGVDPPDLGTGTMDVEMTTASVDPFFSFFHNPTGIRIEIQGGVNVMGSEPVGTFERLYNNTGHDDDGNPVGTLKTWEMSIVTAQMGATVRTFGDGVGPVFDVTFTIRLKENHFSIFSDADESYAFILNVYTNEPPITTGPIEVVPASAGYDFPMTVENRSSMPFWMTDLLENEKGLNVANLERLETVTFDIKVEKAEPTTFLGFAPSPSQAVYDIGIDVFLIGYWERTKPMRDWETPPPKSWLDIFMETVNSLSLQTLVPIAVIMVAVVILYFGAKSTLLGVIRR